MSVAERTVDLLRQFFQSANGAGRNDEPNSAELCSTASWITTLPTRSSTASMDTGESRAQSRSSDEGECNERTSTEGDYSGSAEELSTYHETDSARGSKDDTEDDYTSLEDLDNIGGAECAFMTANDEQWFRAVKEFHHQEPVFVHRVPKPVHKTRLPPRWNPGRRWREHYRNWSMRLELSDITEDVKNPYGAAVILLSSTDTDSFSSSASTRSSKLSSSASQSGERSTSSADASYISGNQRDLKSGPKH